MATVAHPPIARRPHTGIEQDVRALGEELLDSLKKDVAETRSAFNPKAGSLAAACILAHRLGQKDEAQALFSSCFEVAGKSVESWHTRSDVLFFALAAAAGGRPEDALKITREVEGLDDLSKARKLAGSQRPFLQSSLYVLGEADDFPAIEAAVANWQVRAKKGGKGGLSGWGVRQADSLIEAAEYFELAHNRRASVALLKLASKVASIIPEAALCCSKQLRCLQALARLDATDAAQLAFEGLNAAVKPASPNVHDLRAMHAAGLALIGRGDDAIQAFDQAIAKCNLRNPTSEKRLLLARRVGLRMIQAGLLSRAREMLDGGAFDGDGIPDVATALYAAYLRGNARDEAAAMHRRLEAWRSENSASPFVDFHGPDILARQAINLGDLQAALAILQSPIPNPSPECVASSAGLLYLSGSRHEAVTKLRQCMHDELAKQRTIDPLYLPARAYWSFIAPITEWALEWRRSSYALFIG